MMNKKFLGASLFAGAALLLACKALSSRQASVGHEEPGNAEDPVYDRIDGYIAEQMARLHIPGAMLTVVSGDRIVHQRGFGKARPGGETPTPQTPFFIGSLTKSFTALALLQLVEAGKVALDDPVQCYLPWLTLADTQAARQITVRHLLNQTSGFSTWSGWIPVEGPGGCPDAVQRLARSMAKIRLEHPVGTTFAYSNLNYILLGQIIEAASGQRYADYVQAHIFDPLEMRHSYTGETAAAQNGMAAGYRYWFWHPFPSPNMQEPRSSLPGGGLIASAEDLGHFLIAHLNAGRWGEQQILSPAGVTALHHPAAPIHILNWTAHYGMGWYVENLGQEALLWHGGTLPNFASVAGLLPAQKKGFVLLINADHYLMNPAMTEIGHALAGFLAGQQAQPGPLGIRFAQIAPWAARGLLLIPLLQIFGVLATKRRLRRWNQAAVNRPSRRCMWSQHILLPFVLNLGFAFLPVYFYARKKLKFLLDYCPDFAWITMMGGAFAGAWAFLRTALMLQELGAKGPAQNRVR